jgi:hypothetical protein
MILLRPFPQSSTRRRKKGRRRTKGVSMKDGVLNTYI